MAVFYLANTSDQSNKDKAFSIYKLVGGIGYILGSLICPLIYFAFGFYFSFLFFAALYFVLAVTV